MKETLLLQAKYNQAANQAMFALFTDMAQKGKKEELYKDCGLYFKSIIHTLSHTLCANISILLGSIGVLLEGKTPEIEELKQFVQPGFTIKEDILQDLEQLGALQEKTDKLIIQVIANTNDFTKIETIYLGKDFSVTKSRMHLILALLNHATHHRGQIAGALDILNIDNDFAGMLLL